jgi:hypothetical protein
VHDPARAVRSRRRMSARTDGSAASVRQRRVGFTDPTRADGPKDDGDYVRTVCLTAARVRRCTARPTPNVRRIERRRNDLSATATKNRKGERSPTDGPWNSAGGRRAGTPKRDRSRRLAASGKRATRLTCAKGDKTSGEVPDRPPRRAVRPVVTGPPVVPQSADWFGWTRRSRARTPRRRRTRNGAAVTTRVRVRCVVRVGKSGQRIRRRPTRRNRSTGDIDGQRASN